MSKLDQLRELYTRLEQAAPTLPLAHTATDIVPGEGPVTAEIMFIGEAPGEQEAIQRRPFVGKSGKLFRQVLNEVGQTQGLTEKDVYISNIVKVRPPANRDPLPEEIAAYRPYLDEEITILNPLLIVTLGRLSMGKFLPQVKVSQVHGRLHKVKWNGRTVFVLPMYHPAAALRATQMKQSFVEDFQKLAKILEWVRTQRELVGLQDQVAAELF